MKTLGKSIATPQYIPYLCNLIVLRLYFFVYFISARQHIAYMLSTLYAIARLSVRPSVTWVNHSKTVEVRIMKLLPYGSPISIVFAG